LDVRVGNDVDPPTTSPRDPSSGKDLIQS